MLALFLAVALLVPAAPTATAKVPDDEQQIRAAFETAFDSSRPLDERAAVVEHGRTLRPALRWRDSYAGLAGGDVQAKVGTVRVYGDRAEVHFEFLHPDDNRSLGGLIPFGVAVRGQGTWKVSEHTVCEIAAIVGDGCPARDASTEWRDRWQGAAFRLHRGDDSDGAALPITFADGSSVTVTLPHDVSPGRLFVRSQASLRVAGTITSIAIVHEASRVPTLAEYRSRSDGPAVLDYAGTLDLRVGRWTVMVDAGTLSPRERALIARELRPRLAQSGMVALETGPQLELHRSIPDTGGSRARKGPVASDPLAPVVQVTPVDGPRPFGALSVAHTGCSQATLEQDTQVGAAPWRCFDDIGVELSVVGSDSDFLDRLVRETTVEPAS